MPMIWHTRGTTDLAELQQRAQPAALEGARHRSAGVERRRGRGVLRVPGTALAAPDIQIHVAPSGFYDNGFHEPTVADVHRRRDAGVGRQPRLAAAALGRPGHGTRRSTPAYFDDQADLDAMLAGMRRTWETCRQGPLVAAPRPALAAARPSRADEDLVEHARALGPDALPPGRDLRDGHRRGRRGRPVAAGARRRRPAGGGRLVHARRTPGEHQRTHHHDRREGGRARSGGAHDHRRERPDHARRRAAETFDSLNPRTGDVVGTYPIHGAAEVRAAVERAREAARLVGRAVLRRARASA